MKKRIILIIILLLSFFMISAVSASSDAEKSANSDVIHKEKVTTPIDKSSSNDDIAKKSNTTSKSITLLKSVNADKKNETSNLLKETYTPSKKTSNTKKEDQLKETKTPQEITTWNDLKNKINQMEPNTNVSFILKNNINIQDENNNISIINGKIVNIDGNGYTISNDLEYPSTHGVFYVERSSLILENLKINNAQNDQNGGVIRGSYATLTIKNCSFTNNQITRSGGGGGVICIYSKSYVDIVNCNFINNTLAGAGSTGGALNFNYMSDVIVRNCIFTENKATGITTPEYSEYTYGGAMAYGIAINCTFKDNSAIRGEAMSNGIAILCTFENNDNYMTTIVTPALCVSDFSSPCGSGEKLLFNLTYEDPTTHGTKTIDDFDTTISVYRDDGSFVGNYSALTGMENGWIVNLPMGIYRATLTLDGHPEVEPVDALLKINKPYPNFTIQNIPDTITDQEITITIHETHGLNGAVTIKSGETIICNVKIENGYGTNTTRITKPGIYNLTLNFEGNENFTEKNITSNNFKIMNKTSFSALYKNINQSIETGIPIILDYDYIYDPNTDSEYTNGIIITNKVTINGNGKTIDGLKVARIFNVTSNGNLNLENLTIQNGHTIYNGGAIITYQNSQINITNCRFIANIAEHNGGAIYSINASKITVNSSLFINNSGNEGSAIYGNYPNDLIANNNIFLNNIRSNTIILLYPIQVNLDYNWFGHNATDYTNIGGIVKGTTLTNWLFLNATANPDPVQVLSISNITFKLSLYNSSNREVSKYNNSQLKVVNLTINSINGTINKDSVVLGDTITYTPNFVTGSVTASINNINYTKKVNIISEKSFTALYENIKKSLESGQNIITLTHNYTYDNTTDKNLKTGIPINTTIQIIGNGYTINGNNQARIFNVTSSGDLTIENLTLTNGKAQNIGNYYGGVIYAEENSYINLNNIIFQNNNAPTEYLGSGGSIYAKNTTIIINNTQFNNNIGSSGGAIYATSSSINISNSNFNNNNATNSGGAIDATSSSINISNSNFNNNNATNSGGAIFASSAVNVTYSKFKNNHVQYNGGAIYISNNQNNFVISCIFVNNTGTNPGSAIHDAYEGSLKINNNIFLNADSNTIKINNPRKVNLDCNWFGNTADNYGNKPNIGAYINNWLFLNATANQDNIIGLGASSGIVFELYLYNESAIGNKILDYNNTKIKPIYLTITPTKGEIKEKITQLGDTITYKSTEYGKGSITASIESISYTKEVNIISETSFTALYENIKKSLESGQNIITLTHNYTYNDTTDENLKTGIPINTTIQIIGNGYTISGNNTARIFNVTSNGNLTLENLTLTNGKAQKIGSDTYGGAIYAEADIIINNTQFNNNMGEFGGAIYANYSSTVIISNSNFNNNNATTYGGAIYSNAAVDVVYSEFKNNHAQDGGAIRFNNNENNIVSSCIFVNNTATSSGSAICEYDVGSLEINNNIFLNADSKTIALKHLEKVNCDYNWFGNTADNYTANPYIGEHISSWLFLNATVNPEMVQFGDTIDIVFELFLYNSSTTKASIYDNSQLKPVNLTIKSNPNIDRNIVLLGDKILYTANNVGIDSVTARIENVEYGVNLDVNKLEKTTQISDLSIPDTLYQNKDALITGRLVADGGLAKQEIIISITNSTGYERNYTATTDSNGNFSKIINENILGDIIIKISYKGNETQESIYKASNITKNSKIIAVTYNIEFNSLEKSYDYNSTVIISGHVTSNYNLDVKYINLTINGKEPIAVQLDADGMFNYPIKDIILSGLYPIVANYNGHTNTTQFFIKYPTKFTITVTNSTTDKAISVNVFEDNKFTGTINLNINGHDYELTLLNGEGNNNNILINTPGTYTATIDYSGNETYNATNSKSNIFTVKYPTKFTITDIPDTTTDKTITINIIESNGFTGPVNVKISTTNYKIQLTNGKGKQNIKINTPGTYTAQINYPGNNEYTNTTTNSNKFTIKYPTKFTITDIPDTTTDKTITINIIESNGFTGPVNVKISTTNYKIQLTNGKGKQNIKINTPGTYTAQINYPGNNEYTKTNTLSNTFNIKYPTKFTIQKIPNITQGSPLKLTITEKNKYTGPVKVKIGTKTYTVKLNKGTGKKTVTPKLSPGKYNAKIRFTGNHAYNKTSTNSNKFTIKYPTKFTIQKIPNITQGSPLKLTITEKNKYTGPVKVKIGSKTYIVKLNKGTGKKTVTPKLSPGTYVVKIRFGGNKKYIPANTISNKFQIKIDTRIIAVKKKTFYAEANNKNYYVILKDVNGRFIRNAQVTLKVKGKTYKTKTKNKGIATLKLNKLEQKGKYTAIIRYAGDKTYKSSYKKVKITVQLLFPIVSKGSKDKKMVTKIQKALQKNGYYLHAGKHYLKIDGIYYNWTQKEVQRYQKNNKLPVTGKVDYKTAHKLGII